MRTPSTLHLRRAPAIAAAALVAVLVAGCGSGSSTAPAASAPPASAAPVAPAVSAPADAASPEEAGAGTDGAADATSSAPTPAPSAASSASASTSSTPAPSPSPVGSPTPIAFGHADLVLDLARATSDAPGEYSRPTQGCWPVAYNADPAKSTFTVTPDGTLTGHCEQETGIWIIDGDLSGAIDPATGAVTFDLVTKTVYKGQVPGTFALTISGTGVMAGGSVAKGDATWTVACTAGTIKCSFDPAHRDTFQTQGTVPWTITLQP